MSRNPTTPRALVDLYWSMPAEDKRTFLQLLGKGSDALIPFIIAQGLSEPQQLKLAELFTGAIQEAVFPLMAQQAIQLVKENPELRTEDLAEQVAQMMDRHDRELGAALNAELKCTRDRTSSPAIINRNATICDEHNRLQNRRSLGGLAQDYGLSRGTIKEIWRDRDRWWAERDRLGASTQEEE